MGAGQVNRALLTSFYQNAGDTYDDNKTEGAFGVLADQVDANYVYTAGLVNQATLAQASQTPVANKIAQRDANGDVVNALPRSNGQNPNLLFNPSFRLGFTGWTKSGGDGTWVVGFGGGGEGGYLQVTSPVATPNTSYYESQRIPSINGIQFSLQAEIIASGQTAGSAPQVEIHAFNTSNVDLGVIATVNLALGTNWTKVTATGITPANTAYVVVRIIYWTGSISTITGFRKIKIESGSVVTTFGDDSTMNTYQYGNVMPFAQILSGGNKIQSGTASITTGAAAGVYSVTITFPVAFATAPKVKPSTLSNIPNVIGQATANTPTTTGVTLYIYQSDAIARTISVDWEAAG